MKKIHRILTALCAATICFSLPIMASCSTPGSTKPSNGEPTRREMPTESSEDSHGRFPGEPLPLLPEFPEFPGHTEGPEEGKSSRGTRRAEMSEMRERRDYQGTGGLGM
mgnify:CR=1 FL=1